MYKGTIVITNKGLGKDQNGKKISRTEPHRFLHLTRANSYFRTKYGILNSNLKYGILNSKSDQIRFKLCSTDYYFSTFYSESSEPNLVQLAHEQPTCTLGPHSLGLPNGPAEPHLLSWPASTHKAQAPVSEVECRRPQGELGERPWCRWHGSTAGPRAGASRLACARQWEGRGGLTGWQRARPAVRGPTGGTGEEALRAAAARHRRRP